MEWKQIVLLLMLSTMLLTLSRFRTLAGDATAASMSADSPLPNAGQPKEGLPSAPAPSVPHPQGGTTAGSQLRVAVRGDETPELIPDRLAYYHLIRAAAIESSTDGAAALLRRGHMMEQIGLSPDDREVFIAALEGVREELTRIELDRRQWTFDTSTARASLELLKQQEVQAMEWAQARLETNLSQDGLRRVDNYVHDSVKRRIVIYNTVVPED
jgi:hypothetical protein